MIRPLNGFVLVRLDPTPDTYDADGYVLIPEQYRDVAEFGTVLAAGPGKELPNGVRVTPEVSPGDRVRLHRWNLTEVEVDGEPCVVMMEDDILWKETP